MIKNLSKSARGGRVVIKKLAVPWGRAGRDSESVWQCQGQDGRDSHNLSSSASGVGGS